MGVQYNCYYYTFAEKGNIPSVVLCNFHYHCKNEPAGYTQFRSKVGWVPFANICSVKCCYIKTAATASHRSATDDSRRNSSCTPNLLMLKYGCWRVLGYPPAILCLYPMLLVKIGLCLFDLYGSERNFPMGKFNVLETVERFPLLSVPASAPKTSAVQTQMQSAYA